MGVTSDGSERTGEEGGMCVCVWGGGAHLLRGTVDPDSRSGGG